MRRRICASVASKRCSTLAAAFRHSWSSRSWDFQSATKGSLPSLMLPLLLFLASPAHKLVLSISSAENTEVLCFRKSLTSGSCCSAWDSWALARRSSSARTYTPRVTANCT